MCFLHSPSSIYNLEANPRLLVAEGFLNQANTNLVLPEEMPLVDEVSLALCYSVLG